MDVLACLIVCGYNVCELLDETVTDNHKWARWVKRIETLQKEPEE